ncbi:MAG: PASTA domain-containing protein, partial [Solirubrobacterales bacterium]|nr:PASTA domain-containing protein [Solirubrobacterales bacterium]
WWVAAGVLAAIALAAGAVALLTPATSVRVPEVRNRTEAQALEIIHRRGLQATVASAPSNWFAPGIVITQEPLPGDFLAGGARVRIVVSRGPGSVLVPAVGGYTETRARATLRAAGLTVGVRTGASNVEGRGLVISTSPSPNARVAHGSRVTVLVSTGPEAVLAPTLVGKSLAEAEGALEQAGLKVGAVRHQRSSQAEAGTVLSQSPGAGASVHVGAVVDLVVAQAPSRPPSHASSAVPSVVGQPAGQARAALREAGFSVRRATRRVSNPALVGLVVQQSPPAGEPAQSHSTVTITVGVAGHTPGTTTTTTTTPSPTTTPTTTTTTSTTTSAVPPAAAAPGG